MLHTQIENEQNCWTIFTSVYNSVSMVWPTKHHKKTLTKNLTKGAENEVKSFQKKFHSKCVCVRFFFSRLLAKSDAQPSQLVRCWRIEFHL